MNHWPFIAVAYGLTLLSIASMLIGGWLAMRRAEALASDLTGAR